MWHWGFINYTETLNAFTCCNAISCYWNVTFKIELDHVVQNVLNHKLESIHTSFEVNDHIVNNSAKYIAYKTKRLLCNNDNWLIRTNIRMQCIREWVNHWEHNNESNKQTSSTAPDFILDCIMHHFLKCAPVQFPYYS